MLFHVALLSDITGENRYSMMPLSCYNIHEALLQQMSYKFFKFISFKILLRST